MRGMLYSLFRHRVLYGLGLLIVVLAHFVFAHHEGQPELVLCQHQNQMTLEASAGHADDQEHACEHDDNCHDVHLSFYHPETYNVQTLAPVEHGFDQLLAVVDWDLFRAYQVAAAPLFPLTAGYLAPEAQPPPDEQRAALATVILLI